MKEMQIVMPNEVIFAEMEDCLRRGDTVRIPLRGRSMEPLLQEGRDTVVLVPLSREVRKGDVVLFFYQGRYLLHRVVRVKGCQLVTQGDASHVCEQIELRNVVALLKEVERMDGTVISCNSKVWLRDSRKALVYNRMHNIGKRFFNHHIRKRLAPIYFVCLAILMWMPMGFMGIPLNNFVFGIRLDHLLHASIYIPCTWFLMDSFKFRRGIIWLLAIAVAITTETGQYFLPYRGFDVNDMVANFLGVTLGWFVIIKRNNF